MSDAAPASPAVAPLDDVMLAMDVVDTLRHRQLLVAEELGTDDREAALLARLRDIYAGQGIDVSDEVLTAGVAALRADRFTYTAPAPTLAVRLAHVYVRRGRWGLRLLGVALVVVLAVVAYRAVAVVPFEALAREAEVAYAGILAGARVPEARDAAETDFARVQEALADRDLAEARAAAADLETLRADVDRTFVLELVTGPDETTGVWRVPDANPAARNFYLIVEAVGPDGRAVRLPIRNEETGEVTTVRRWGVRVDEATFERVAADVADDGIVQDRRFGEKRAGELEIDYRFPTTGEAITSW